MTCLQHQLYKETLGVVSAQIDETLLSDLMAEQKMLARAQSFLKKPSLATKNKMADLLAAILLRPEDVFKIIQQLSLEQKALWLEENVLLVLNCAPPKFFEDIKKFWANSQTDISSGYHFPRVVMLQILKKRLPFDEYKKLLLAEILRNKKTVWGQELVNSLAEFPVLAQDQEFMLALLDAFAQQNLKPDLFDFLKAVMDSLQEGQLAFSLAVLQRLEKMNLVPNTELISFYNNLDQKTAITELWRLLDKKDSFSQCLIGVLLIAKGELEPRAYFADFLRLLQNPILTHPAYAAVGRVMQQFLSEHGNEVYSGDEVSPSVFLGKIDFPAQKTFLDSYLCSFQNNVFWLKTLPAVDFLPHQEKILNERNHLLISELALLKQPCRAVVPLSPTELTALKKSLLNRNFDQFTLLPAPVQNQITTLIENRMQSQINELFLGNKFIAIAFATVVAYKVSDHLTHRLDLADFCNELNLLANNRPSPPVKEVVNLLKGLVDSPANVRYVLNELTKNSSLSPAKKGFQQKIFKEVESYFLDDSLLPSKQQHWRMIFCKLAKAETFPLSEQTEQKMVGLLRQGALKMDEVVDLIESLGKNGSRQSLNDLLFYLQKISEQQSFLNEESDLERNELLFCLSRAIGLLYQRFPMTKT